MRRLWRMLREPYSGPAWYRWAPGWALSIDASLDNIPLPRIEFCDEGPEGCQYIGVSFGNRHSDPIVSVCIDRRRR